MADPPLDRIRNNVEKKQELQINENRWIGLALYIFLITFSVNSHDSSLDEETSSKGSSTALNQSGSETERTVRRWKI